MTRGLKGWIGATEAAKLVGVSREWVNQGCRHGWFTAQQVTPRFWLVDRTSLEAWHDAGRPTNAKKHTQKKRSE